MQSRMVRQFAEAEEQRRSRLFEYALCLLFLLPLVYGVFSMMRLQQLTNEAGRLARDLARMYRQGVDFSAPANRGIATELARGRGFVLAGRSGVAILSRVRVVQDSDCPVAASQPCANAGLAAIEQQIVIGRSEPRHSQTGAPPVDPTTGLVANWAGDPAARATVAENEIRQGEPSWICEVWFTAPDQPGGVYARAAE